MTGETKNFGNGYEYQVLSRQFDQDYNIEVSKQLFKVP